MRPSGTKLQFDGSVLLVGPADKDLKLLRKLAGQGLPVIAADGGANDLLENGIPPFAIIGDFDSLEFDLGEFPSIRKIKLEEQDSADFEKCIYSVNAPQFLAFGFTGMRFDHTMAALHVLQKYHRNKKIVLISKLDISFLQTGNFIHTGAIGRVVSIFPLQPIRFHNSSGLEYSLAGISLEMGRQIGTSNRATAKEVMIEPEPANKNTPYLVTLPIQCLDELLVPEL